MPRAVSAALDRHAISACLRDPAGRPSLAVRPWAALAVGLPDGPRAAAAARAEHAPPAAAVPVPDAAPAADASPAAGAWGLHEVAEPAAAAPHGRFAAAVAVVQHAVAVAVAAPARDGRPVAA